MPELYKQQILFFLINIFVVFSVVVLYYLFTPNNYLCNSIATMAPVPSASAQLLQLPVGHVSYSRY